MNLVKIALQRPYMFIVMAALILIFGIGAALKTPSDIFPNINIPVVAVVFSYAGLSPDDVQAFRSPSWRRW
jgi:multidrug efflux pump subunit AcrB